jgi:hypothetical protein
MLLTRLASLGNWFLDFTHPTEVPIVLSMYFFQMVYKTGIFIQLQYFVGTDHLRTKTIINDETLEQVSQFSYLDCSISYQFSNDMELKLAKFLQLICTIKRTIFRKVITKTILKIYNTLILPTFNMGQKTGL